MPGAGSFLFPVLVATAVMVCMEVAQHRTAAGDQHDHHRKPCQVARERPMLRLRPFAEPVLLIPPWVDFQGKHRGYSSCKGASATTAAGGVHIGEERPARYEPVHTSCGVGSLHTAGSLRQQM